MPDAPLSDRSKLTVPQFPTMPDGSTLMAMRVSSEPERFIYGDADTLAWIREWFGHVALDERQQGG